MIDFYTKATDLIRVIVISPTTNFEHQMQYVGPT